MRVRFLLGPAGSGKTFRCLAEIRARLIAEPQGPPLILLAPRQATYQLELQLLARPGLAGYARLQIISFERFAAWLLDRLAVAPRELLSAEGRLMVLRVLLHRHHGELKVFRESGRSSGFAQRLSDQLHELQQHRVPPGTLLKAAAQLQEDGSLTGKLRDLALLLEKYESWLRERQLPDAGTLLDQATAALRLAARFPNPPKLTLAGIWLDGIAELTPQERELLAALAPFCPAATLAFCLETAPGEDTPWLSTWSVVGQTFRRCHARIAAEPECEVSVEVIARDPTLSRFRSATATGDSLNALHHLEAHWTTPVTFPKPAGDALSLVRCADPEGEAVMAAREILRFVQAGHRFRDCAVLLRQMDSHHASLRRVFRRYGIPYFLDRRDSVAHHPLAEFTRGALHTVLFHWRLTDWFGVLKTGLTPLTADEVDRLENIAIARGWEGGRWLQPIELPGDPLLARDCEALRQRVIAPFERLRQVVLGEPSGRALATALRRLWDDFEVAATLDDWSRKDTEQEAGVHLTVLDGLSEWLDNLERAFGDFALPLKEWLPILEAGLGALSVGVIPPAIDQVLIGAVDRSRNPDLKLALVLGLNEGLFPRAPASLGLLTDEDRDTLEAAAVQLRGDPRQRLGHERYLGYIACTRARERVVLSWSAADAGGRGLNVSPLVDHVRQLFPGLAVTTFEWPDARAEWIHASELLGPLLRSAMNSAGDAADRVDSSAAPTIQIDGLNQPGSPVQAILGISANRGEPEPAARSNAVTAAERPASPSLREWLAHFTACATSYRQSRLAPAAVEQLFGKRLQTSASRLEQFAACPFQFFVSAGLRARERDRFEVDARKTGTFLHEVLRAFHEELTAESLRWRSITADDARARIDRLAGQQLKLVAGGVLGAHPRHVFQARSMSALLQEFVATTIAWMRTYHFDPIAVEQRIGEEQGALRPWEIDLGAGRTLVFRGSVDRIDAAPTPGRPESLSLTVVDYKSGNRRFEPLKLRAGLQVQLTAYLAALTEIAASSPMLEGKAAVPAGMFYIHLKDGSQRGDSRDALDLQGRNKAFEHMGRFSFEHLTLFDSDSANGGSGQFSYRLKQDGEPYANSHQLVRQTDLETLLTETKAILQAMGREILAGTIAVDPYRKGSERPCTFCEYQSICRIDPWAHRYRPLKPILAAGP